MNQTFDTETVGAVPLGWYVTNPQYGNITVASGGYGSTTNSAAIIDNSSNGNPEPYRLFPEQSRTIGISFAIKATNNTGSGTIIEVFVDDGNFNGADLLFKDGNIEFRDTSGSFVTLRSGYVPNRWYLIKLVLKVPDNKYDIYIDEHVEWIGAGFRGTCTQLDRVVFNETSGKDGLALPVAYIDELLGRQVIQIPQDYQTIQDGIDVANPNDIVFVTGQRTYYENIIISKSIELVGENRSTTVIDNSHQQHGSKLDGILILADNVLVHEFTIRSTPYGAGVHVAADGCTIDNTTITNGLSDGIDVIGSNNYISSNLIETNLQCGIQLSGSNCTMIDNTIRNNDASGIVISGSGSNVTANDVRLNLGNGIWIQTGDQNVLQNNTIRQNTVGVRCDLGTKDNLIYENRFIGNTHVPQALDNGDNRWDDGYPYVPANRTGGGNYWSDFSCTDIYAGANQNLLCPFSFPYPDGIADQPYNLSLQTQDKYPLFVIQNVSQSPDIITNDSCGCPQHKIDYDVPVTVTAKMLDNVTFDDAFLLVLCNSSFANITMTNATDNLWTGTIPGQKYGTQVTYNASAHASFAPEVNSTNYPLTGPYLVIDRSLPSIDTVVWTPQLPDEKQSVTVYAHVTEPKDASGVAGVFLTYKFGGTWWTANMTEFVDDNYTGSIPPQPGNASLSFIVSAIDNAGNGNSGITSNTTINNQPMLYVTNNITSFVAIDPALLDEAVMYRGEVKTDSRLILINMGQENLAWNITGGSFWIQSISQTSGVILPGKSTTITLTINTTECFDPNLYVTPLNVNANGTIPRWAVMVEVLVRDIMIDQSWSIATLPQRSNINTIVPYAYHAEWAHNATDAIVGTITVNGTILPVPVNAAGWAIFNPSSSSPIQNTFIVTRVDFNYTKDGLLYHIISFNQKAPVVTIIWDRVNVVLKVVDDRINVDSNATITWTDSVYESDNSPFAGNPFINDTLNKHTVGKYYFTTSSINDTKYNLTAFRSNVISCVWDRIRVIAGGVLPSNQTQVGGTETIWLVAIYDYDNLVFKGTNGTLYLDAYQWNVSSQTWGYVRTDPMDWDSMYERWQKTYSFDTAAPWAFTVSRVRLEDRVYNLTATEDLVGPIGATWGTGIWTPWPWRSPDLPTFLDAPAENVSAPGTSQNGMSVPFWFVPAIAVTLAIGLVLIFMVLLVSSKRRNGTRAKITSSDKAEPQHKRIK